MVRVLADTRDLRGDIAMSYIKAMSMHVPDMLSAFSGIIQSNFNPFFTPMF